MSDEEHCTGASGEGHQHDITCREVGEFLLAYLERDLDEPARAEFERHLKLCPPCVHYLDGYRDTIELVRACANEDADAKRACSGEGGRPRPPPEGLIQAILAAKKGATRRDP